ncbi:MAG TPA: ABC transporter permease [Thermotogota bacterium]|nr:ABC transporter permease [Thermotogota bacterium]HPJ88980.1 ABC transporter permease [Thermotogota bacterium]HPR97261.1 ABC transporter permease [Thermotogota bacterium]
MKRHRKAFAERNLIIILVLMWVLLALVTGGKFSSSLNITNLIRQASINGVVAIAMTFIIITGGIDLSVGSVVGLSGMVFATMTSTSMDFGLSIPVAILLALGASALVGLVNGIAIHDGKVPPFIATLGTMTLVRGLVMYISDGRMVTGLPKEFKAFSSAAFLGIPSLAWTWLIIALVAALVMKYTKFGRNLYAIGSNPEAARLAGINIRLNMYFFYIVGAILCGVAGLMLSTRLAAGVPTAGQSYELDAIASVVIGGASMTGGVGTALGTVLGALIIQTIKNGGNLLGIDPFIMQMVIGAIIVLAVFFDTFFKSKGKKLRLFKRGA